MNFQHLRYFRAACSEQNISRAAEKLNVSQSSISLAIKNLENEFGISLIKRQRVGFALTEDGADFLALVDSLLEHIEKVQAIMAEKKALRKTINFGIPPMLCAIYLPVLFGSFQKEHSDIKIAFQEGGAYELLEKLRDRLLDMALIPADDLSSLQGIAGINICKFEEVCCVHNAHPLAKKRDVTPEEIAKYPVVIATDQFYHTDKISAMFGKDNVSAQYIHRTTQLSTMEQLICQNLAVGFLFRKRAERIPEISCISLKPKMYTNVALVWQEKAFLTEDMKIVIDFLKTYKEL